MPTPKFDCLPDPIRDVTIPRYFSPSRWEAMENCPLSVWGHDRAVLPETPESIAGRLLHDVREMILRQGAVGSEQTARAKSIISEVKQSYELRLSANPDYSAIVPLDQAYGRRKWIDRVQTMLTWAANEKLTAFVQSPKTVLLSGDAPKISDLTQVQPDTFSTGLEQPWVCNELRLRGKPDEAKMGLPGVVEVLDFKSGAVFDSQGELKTAVETQLRLYMLMAEKLTGYKSMGTVSTNSGSCDIKWTKSDRMSLIERVLNFCAAHPLGTVVDASAVAVPGAYCSACRLRPRCSRYLSDIPWEWKRGGESFRLPFDTWGEVLEKCKENTGWYLRIRDAVDRTVVITGLSDAHGIQEIKEGNTVFVFDAQPSEEICRHGSRLVPLSFHERAPGLNRSSAKQLRLYVRSPL